MIEKYNGWSIVTKRDGNLSDLITKRVKFGKYGYVQLFVESDRLGVVSSHPFSFKDINLRSLDIHSKCNEADDAFRAEITNLNSYLLEIVNQLPEI